MTSTLNPLRWAVDAVDGPMTAVRTFSTNSGGEGRPNISTKFVTADALVNVTMSTRPLSSFSFNFLSPFHTGFNGIVDWNNINSRTPFSQTVGKLIRGDFCTRHQDILPRSRLQLSGNCFTMRSGWDKICTNPNLVQRINSFRTNCTDSRVSKRPGIATLFLQMAVENLNRVDARKDYPVVSVELSDCRIKCRIDR